MILAFCKFMCEWVLYRTFCLLGFYLSEDILKVFVDIIKLAKNVRFFYTYEILKEVIFSINNFKTFLFNYLQL